MPLSHPKALVTLAHADKKLMRKLFLILTLLSASNAWAFNFNNRTLFIEGGGQKGWYNPQYPDESVKILLQKLSLSPTGKFLIKKAYQKATESGKTLLQVIIPGEGSLTDTTLVRQCINL